MMRGDTNWEFEKKKKSEWKRGTRCEPTSALNSLPWVTDQSHPAASTFIMLGGGGRMDDIAHLTKANIQVIQFPPTRSVHLTLLLFCVAACVCVTFGALCFICRPLVSHRGALRWTRRRCQFSARCEILRRLTLWSRLACWLAGCTYQSNVAFESLKTRDCVRGSTGLNVSPLRLPFTDNRRKSIEAPHAHTHAGRADVHFLQTHARIGVGEAKKGKQRGLLTVPLWQI